MAKRTNALPKTYVEAREMVSKAVETSGSFSIPLLYNWMLEKARNVVMRGFNLATVAQWDDNADIFEIGINCAGRLEGGKDYRRWIDVHIEGFSEYEPERAFSNLIAALEKLETLDNELAEAEARYLLK